MFVKYKNQSKSSCRKEVLGYQLYFPGDVKSNPKSFFRYPKKQLNGRLVDNDKIISDDSSIKLGGIGTFWSIKTFLIKKTTHENLKNIFELY